MNPQTPLLKPLPGLSWRIDAVEDADGNSLLHNSMTCYGRAHADGNRHSHNNLPIILAGSGGGALTPARYNKFSSQPVTTCSSAWLTGWDVLASRATAILTVVWKLSDLFLSMRPSNLEKLI